MVKRIGMNWNVLFLKIVADNGPIIKTKVMMKMNTTYTRMNGCFKRALKNEFVVYKPIISVSYQRKPRQGDTKITITREGFQYLLLNEHLIR